MSGFVFGTSGFGFSPGTIPGGGGTVATTGPRTYLSDFALANPIYAGAQVAIVTVDPVTLRATQTLAPIYADLVSAVQLANPQVLDGEGKWQQPVYISGACIALVAGASDSAANTTTGIEGTIVGFQGDWVSGRQYFTGAMVRDGVNGNNTSGVYFCDTPHVSGVFGTDLASGVWLVYVDTPAILNNIITSTLNAAQASASAAAASETAASNDATQAGIAAAAASGFQTGAGVASSSAQISALASAASAAAAAAAAAPAGVNNVGRNLIHNGMFRVQQRGAGVWTGTNFTADRWRVDKSAGTFTASIITLTDADRTAIGDEDAAFALQCIGVGSAGAPDFILAAQQSIEGVRRLAAKTVKVSFWARATSGTPNVGLELVQNFGTGGSPSAVVNSIGSQPFSLSTVWTRCVSGPIAVPSASGKTLGTAGNDFTGINFWQSSGATNNSRAAGIGAQSYTLQITGIQLEVGSAVTQLEKPDRAIELVNCRRFFRNGSAQYYGYQVGTTLLAISQPLEPPMRAAPTIVYTGVVSTNATGTTVAALDAGAVNINATAIATGAFALQGTFTASADL